MVFHAFKGDEEIDAILHSIPFGQRSKFMKEKIKAGVLPDEPPKESTAKKRQRVVIEV